MKNKKNKAETRIKNSASATVVVTNRQKEQKKTSPNIKKTATKRKTGTDPRLISCLGALCD